MKSHPAPPQTALTWRWRVPPSVKTHSNSLHMQQPHSLSHTYKCIQQETLMPDKGCGKGGTTLWVLHQKHTCGPPTHTHCDTPPSHPGRHNQTCSWQQRRGSVGTSSALPVIHYAVGANSFPPILHQLYCRVGCLACVARRYIGVQ